MVITLRASDLLMGHTWYLILWTCWNLSLVIEVMNCVKLSLEETKSLGTIVGQRRPPKFLQAKVHHFLRQGGNTVLPGKGGLAKF